MDNHHGRMSGPDRKAWAVHYAKAYAPECSCGRARVIEVKTCPDCGSQWPHSLCPECDAPADRTATWMMGRLGGA